jgi:hypothetical protein
MMSPDGQHPTEPTDDDVLRVTWTADGHVDDGTIHAWLDGAFDEVNAHAVSVHVTACATCSAAVAEARGLLAGSSRILRALDDVPAGVVPADDVRRTAARMMLGEEVAASRSIAAWPHAPELQTARRAAAAPASVASAAAPETARSRVRIAPWLRVAAAVIVMAGGSTWVWQRGDGGTTVPASSTDALTRGAPAGTVAAAPTSDSVANVAASITTALAEQNSAAAQRRRDAQTASMQMRARQPMLSGSASPAAAMASAAGTSEATVSSPRTSATDARRDAALAPAPLPAAPATVALAPPVVAKEAAPTTPLSTPATAAGAASGVTGAASPASPPPATTPVASPASPMRALGVATADKAADTRFVAPVRDSAVAQRARAFNRAPMPLCYRVEAVQIPRDMPTPSALEARATTLTQASYVVLHDWPRAGIDSTLAVATNAPTAMTLSLRASPVLQLRLVGDSLFTLTDRRTPAARDGTFRLVPSTTACAR